MRQSMRICHISDTHGNLNPLRGKFDIIIHSGDFFPDYNIYKAGIIDSKDFQQKYLAYKVKKIKGQVGTKPFFFVLGNHDFVDPDLIENILRDNDINAFSLHNKIVNYNDFSFYGFPYVPYINGCWNYELDSSQMKVKSSNLIKDIKGKKVDVIVAHAPLHGFLDQTSNGTHIGNNILIDYLTYKLDVVDLPKWYLCGHVHESHGINCDGSIFVSNAATTQNIIELF
jgi:Icc-related predicted phosphoesterase